MNIDMVQRHKCTRVPEKLLSQSTISCISKFWQDMYTKFNDNIVKFEEIEKFGTWFNELKK
jgi:hypothetical protein